MDANKKGEVRNELREVARELRSWDPIGVIVDPSNPENPLDEYDSYAPEVLRLLKAGIEARLLADHLESIARSQMGLALPLEFHLKFSEYLLAWWNAR